MILSNRKEAWSLIDSFGGWKIGRPNNNLILSGPSGTIKRSHYFVFACFRATCELQRGQHGKMLVKLFFARRVYCIVDFACKIILRVLCRLRVTKQSALTLLSICVCFKKIHSISVLIDCPQIPTTPFWNCSLFLNVDYERGLQTRFFERGLWTWSMNQISRPSLNVVHDHGP